MIPLVDLKKQYKEIRQEIDRKIREIINSTDFINGKYVREFEEKFAKKQKIKHIIGCSSGTSALFIILKALGVGRGDEVITTPHTFIATVEAICQTGAKPVFVDIDPGTYNIDINKIEKAISKKTKVILPVHIYGNPVNMEKLMSLARKRKILVVEDCAQAHLSFFNNKPVGSFGLASGFSFYPGKNLGAYGDAGLIATNNKRLADKCRLLINHGRKEKYVHEVVGYNNRMDCLQAGILLVKLRYLSEWTKKRRMNARIYNKYLGKNKNIVLPKETKNGVHVYHLYVVRVNNRNEVIEQLKKNGVSYGIHYPVPLHLQKALEYLGYKRGDFPVTEEISRSILSLPMYPELTKKKIITICKIINKVAK
mgnify:CR=1 FL=1